MLAHKPRLSRLQVKPTLCDSECTIDEDDDTNAEVCGDPIEDAASAVSDEEDL